MAESANFSPGASSGKKVSVQHTSVNIRGSKKAEQKDSRRRISCKDLGNGECEGWMWSKKEKSGFGPNSWRNYWFMLKDKSLYCYKDPRDVVARRLYHLPGFVVFVARETSRKYAFKISHASFGTVLFATKDDKDMAKWMTHLNSSCEDTCKRKKSDESTGDISESDNEEDNTEEEEKKSLPPVAERDDETEDRDSTWTAPTTVRLSAAAAAAASSSSAASETEPTHFASSGPELHLLTFCNSESQPVRSSIPESTSSSSSKEESTPLAVADQEPSQLLHPQSNSVHLASPEPELKKHTSEALEPAVAAKKAPGPATPTKPKPSPKSSPSGESSASPTLQRPLLTRPTCAPATLAKPARTAPCTGGQSSTSATGSAPVALALSGHQAASSSKLLPSVTGAASAWPLRTDDVAEGSAKIPFETSNKNMNTGPETCAKQSSTDTDMTAPGDDNAVASVPSLPGRLINEPAFSATPSAAASFTRACSAAECSATELAASTTNTKNVGPSTFAKPTALLRAVSDTIPPNWIVSDHTLSSMPTASAARSSASAMSSSNVNNTSPCSRAHFCIVKQHSVQKEEARLSDVTSLSDTFQSAEALPEFSATKRAHITMTNIAKSMKIKAKPSPANHYQGLCSHLVMLQRSFKDKTQELQTLEELLKTPEMTSDRLKQFCHENRDFAKRLTGSSIVLGESFESDTENRLEDV